ncbi:hypothetical protein GGI25_002287 [Coemansia spiralis]|uniref:Uncharacterized protein n=2 Tax=Coemansia TaxID=4863 RepID=A0A9W8KZH6_9FUNG|nr:hypothetical protein EDC05_001109 [Coemansia umbellata]KAJ2625673.1 hypothetical protein GGI26_000473 [Coemansia sp. RSA 1358]KAJ2678493.1 hypothetical protein GGI25_002287 [Coemansia spiralis]
MHIFSSPKNKGRLQDCANQTGHQTVATDPFERKGFKASLSLSVKTLFSKRCSLSLISPPLKSAPPLSASETTPNATNLPKVVCKEVINTFTGYYNDAALSPISPYSDDGSDSNNGSVGIADRYSQARAKALAETVRRLQQTRSPPVTPSSISTGKTLPCFPEEAEYEDNHQINSILSEKEGEAQALRSKATYIDLQTGSYAARSSAMSSQTITVRSRPISMMADTSSNISARNSSGSSSNSSGGTMSSAASTLRPQSMLSVNNKSLAHASSAHPELAQPSTMQSRTSASWAEISMANLTADPQPKQAQKQRYSVAMSQNLNRRFQTKVTHEYEQRIYCLHAHYSDVIERMETRARKDTEHMHQLEEQLFELRRANTELCAKEAELKKRIQQHKNSKRVSVSDSASGTPRTASVCQSGFNQANLSKKLIEFMDHYQEEVRRLKHDTNTAQEWVITLAELVIGPKKERQSWDEWLNACLDTLQKRRERIKEDEWLRKIGYRPNVVTASN